MRGLDELDDDCWAVLATTRVRLVPVADVAGAVRAPTDRAAQVVIADARKGRALTAAKRRREGASVKPLEEFDFTFQRSVKKTLFQPLGQLDFLAGRGTLSA